MDSAGWQKWDEDTLSWYYVNKETGETSWTPPAVDMQALIAVRDKKVPDAPHLKAKPRKIVSPFEGSVVSFAVLTSARHNVEATP